MKEKLCKAMELWYSDGTVMVQLTVMAMVTGIDGNGAFSMCTHCTRHVAYILSFTPKNSVSLVFLSPFYR